MQMQSTKHEKRKLGEYRKRSDEFRCKRKKKKNRTQNREGQVELSQGESGPASHPLDRCSPHNHPHPPPGEAHK